MSKDVLLGKYKVFEDIIPDLDIYAIKSIDLEKYEYYRDIRHYVKEYHNEIEVNSDEFMRLVTVTRKKNSIIVKNGIHRERRKVTIRIDNQAGVNKKTSKRKA